MKIVNTVTKNCAALLVLAIIILFACKKNPDTSNSSTPETPPDLTTKVAAAVVSGFVTNETDAAVQSASVEVGGITVTTDKYGYFEVRNTAVIQNAATVTINKTGYFKTVKTFIATAGKSAFFRIKLLPKTNAGTISAVTGGAVTLSNGLGISIPANAVVNAATNAIYTGNISVAAQLISATDPNLNRIMPGDLRGLNTSSNLRLLSTYGMMAVELTGSGGELLQIATGKKASITTPIPAAMQASAPSTIPLWYFDETRGLWKEEGSAAKTGSNYVGDVSHFSFWNCDVPSTYIKFDCTVVNAAGQPIPYAYVKATALSNNIYFSDYGYTDSTGYVSGYIPDNAQMKLEIFDNSNCSGAAYSQVFNTSNVNLSLGTIVIASSARLATLNGGIKNCNNAPVTNGYIIMSDGSSLTRYPLSNTGNYSVSRLVCSFPSTINLVGEDVTTNQQSTPVSYTIVNAGINNVPDIVACGVTVSQFVNYVDNGVSFSYSMPADTLTYFAVPTSTSISCYRIPNNTSQYSNLVFSAIVQGQTTVGSSLTVSTFSSPLTGGFTNFISGSVTITELGAISQFVAGNFTVAKTDAQTNVLHNVTGSFRIRRSN